MNLKFPALTSLLLLALCVGCNLRIDVQEYPYSGPGDIHQRPDAADAEPADATPDTAHDADADADDISDVTDTRDEEPPAAKPHLIFTELMPDVSVPPGGNTEYGEYIEVKNVGDAPADPRRIIIQLSGSDRRIQIDPFPSDGDEREAFDALEPIAPGGYFVFVREDREHYAITSRLKKGTFYEYGRWFDSVPLSNSSRRLHMSYRAGEFELDPQDAVEWASSSLFDSQGDSTATLAVREDVAWGVHPDFEDPVSNRDPANWCYHTDEVDGGVVKASPGAPTPANCTVD